MAIVHFRLPSGWVPLEETIANLADDSSAKLKRHELNENKLSLYFEEVRILFFISFFFNRFYLLKINRFQNLVKASDLK